MLAALSYKVFELDRYFVPKELVLHGVAAVLAVGLVVRRRDACVSFVDGLLAAFLGFRTGEALG